MTSINEHFLFPQLPVTVPPVYLRDIIAFYMEIISAAFALLLNPLCVLVQGPIH
jgi:hypothetical protein